MRGNVEIKIKYSEGMEPIKQAHEGEWYDLRCAKDTTMWSGDVAMISLGVAIELPEGFEAILAPRSSTFKQYGIIMTNSIGVIDNLYCGDDDIWHFPALKVRGEPVTIHKNERIAQFRILHKQPHCDIVEVDRLNGTNRGGFGSTGVK